MILDVLDSSLGFLASSSAQQHMPPLSFTRASFNARPPAPAVRTWPLVAALETQAYEGGGRGTKLDFMDFF